MVYRMLSKIHFTHQRQDHCMAAMKQGHPGAVWRRRTHRTLFETAAGVASLLFLAQKPSQKEAKHLLLFTNQALKAHLHKRHNPAGKVLLSSSSILSCWWWSSSPPTKRGRGKQTKRRHPHDHTYALRWPRRNPHQRLRFN
jgi:hypothetical protein